MYPCPNCRAGLRFDIPKQLLVCDHCDSEFNPYTIGRETDAVERDTFEVTVFTCPQCGGELISEDDTAATFCSYCGGSTVLDSRISQEKKPAMILPFKQTKENCEESYRKMVKKAIFTPKEFRDPEQIQKFRAIYMPYWVYDFKTITPEFSFRAQRKERKGDYVYTHHYMVTAKGRGETSGLTYDASSSFADDLSEAIAPYKVDESKQFTPSYFSGFYADCGDVDKDIYIDDAYRFTADLNLQQTLSRSELLGLTVDPMAQGIIKSETKPKLADVQLAMLPVWFLSYKTKDNRVAYTVVNGQTGKAAADLPIDPKRFFAFAGIASALIFALLTMFVAVNSHILLAISLGFSVLMFILTAAQLKKIKKKESREDDQGYLYKKRLDDLKSAQGESQNDADLVDKVVAEVNNNRITVKKAKETRVAKAGLILPIIAIILAAAVMFLEPLEDMIYYAAAAFGVFAVCISEIQLMGRKNLLSTRKLPQLGRRGGDEDE